MEDSLLSTLESSLGSEPLFTTREPSLIMIDPSLEIITSEQFAKSSKAQPKVKEEPEESMHIPETQHNELEEKSVASLVIPETQDQAVLPSPEECDNALSSPNTLLQLELTGSLESISETPPSQELFGKEKESVEIFSQIFETKVDELEQKEKGKEKQNEQETKKKAFEQTVESQLSLSQNQAYASTDSDKKNHNIEDKKVKSQDNKNESKESPTNSDGVLGSPPLFEDENSILYSDIFDGRFGNASQLFREHEIKTSDEQQMTQKQSTNTTIAASKPEEVESNKKSLAKLENSTVIEQQKQSEETKSTQTVTCSNKDQKSGKHDEKISTMNEKCASKQQECPKPSEIESSDNNAETSNTSATPELKVENPCTREKEIKEEQPSEVENSSNNEKLARVNISQDTDNKKNNDKKHIETEKPLKSPRKKSRPTQRTTPKKKSIERAYLDYELDTRYECALCNFTHKKFLKRYPQPDETAKILKKALNKFTPLIRHDDFGLFLQVHECCAIWTPEVYVDKNGEFKNLKKAISRGRKIVSF